MPAGGFKSFGPGVLSSADVNDYLMQGVLVFNDSSDRSSAIGTAVEGMVSYLKDDDKVEAYDGSNWITVSPTVGARIAGIGTATSTGALTISATIPSTTVEGDLLIAVVASIGGTNTTPTGWTLVNRTVSGASNFTVYATYVKTAVTADAGASQTFTVSTSANTSACLAIFAMVNPLAVSNVHGHDVSTGASSTVATDPPTATEGRLPMRFDVFAQYGPPTFSAYTGTGVQVVNIASPFNRMQIFADYDSLSSTSAAQVTSSGSGNWAAASFRMKG